MSPRTSKQTLHSSIHILHPSVCYHRPFKGPLHSPKRPHPFLQLPICLPVFAHALLIIFGLCLISSVSGEAEVKGAVGQTPSTGVLPGIHQNDKDSQKAEVTKGRGPSEDQERAQNSRAAENDGPEDPSVGSSGHERKEFVNTKVSSAGEEREADEESGEVKGEENISRRKDSSAQKNKNEEETQDPVIEDKKLEKQTSYVNATNGEQNREYAGASNMNNNKTGENVGLQNASETQKQGTTGLKHINNEQTSEENKSSGEKSTENTDTERDARIQRTKDTEIGDEEEEKEDRKSSGVQGTKDKNKGGQSEDSSERDVTVDRQSSSDRTPQHKKSAPHRAAHRKTKPDQASGLATVSEEERTTHEEMEASSTEDINEGEVLSPVRDGNRTREILKDSSTPSNTSREVTSTSESRKVGIRPSKSKMTTASENVKTTKDLVVWRPKSSGILEKIAAALLEDMENGNLENVEDNNEQGDEEDVDAVLNLLNDLDTSGERRQSVESSQVVETRIRAPGALLRRPCYRDGSSTACLSYNETIQLRQRLLQDLHTAYLHPLHSRIRYRLKKKPSVYTSKKPKIRPDIGIPDIYEAEVEVTPKFGGPHQSLPLPKPTTSYFPPDAGSGKYYASPRHPVEGDYGVAEDVKYQHYLPSPRRPAYVPLEAVVATEGHNNDSVTAKQSYIPLNRRHEDKPDLVYRPPKRPPGYQKRRTDGLLQRPTPSNPYYFTEAPEERLHEHIHLHYRRPVSFKYQRTGSGKRPSATVTKDPLHREYTTATYPSPKKPSTIIRVTTFATTPKPERSSATYLPPEKGHPTPKPSKDYLPPGKDEPHPTPAKGYTEPPKTYLPPDKEYVPPEQPHPTSPKPHPTSLKAHPTTTRPHPSILKAQPTTLRLHPTTLKPHPTMRKPNPTTSKHYSVPSRTYLPPSKDYAPPPRRGPPLLHFPGPAKPLRTYQPPTKEYLPPDGSPIVHGIPHRRRRPGKRRRKYRKRPSTVGAGHVTPPSRLYLPPNKGDIGITTITPSIAVPPTRYVPPVNEYLPPVKVTTPSPKGSVLLTTPAIKYLPPIRDYKAPVSVPDLAQTYVPPTKDYVPPRKQSTTHLPTVIPKLPQLYVPPSKEYLPPNEHSPTHASTIIPKLPQVYVPPSKEYLPPNKHSQTHAATVIPKLPQLYVPPSKEYLPPNKHSPTHGSTAVPKLPQLYVPPSNDYLPPNKHSPTHAPTVIPKPPQLYVPPSEEYFPPNKYNPTHAPTVIPKPPQLYVPPSKEYLPPRVESPTHAPTVIPKPPQLYLPPNKDYIPPRKGNPTHVTTLSPKITQSYTTPTSTPSRAPVTVPSLSQIYVPPTNEYLPPHIDSPTHTTAVVPKIPQLYVPPSKEYLPPRKDTPATVPKISQVYIPPTNEYLPPKQTSISIPTLTYQPPSKEYLPPAQKPFAQVSTTLPTAYSRPAVSSKPPLKEYVPPQEPHVITLGPVHAPRPHQLGTLYEPPIHEYLPPQKSTPHSQSKYPSPPRTYVPPVNEYLPPKTTAAPGYSPPSLTYQPPNKDYIPPPSGTPIKPVLTSPDDYIPPGDFPSWLLSLKKDKNVPPIRLHPSKSQSALGLQHGQVSRPPAHVTSLPPAHRHKPTPRPGQHYGPTTPKGIATTLFRPDGPLPSYAPPAVHFQPPAKEYLPPKETYVAPSVPKTAPKSPTYVPPPPPIHIPLDLEYLPPKEDYKPPATSKTLSSKVHGSSTHPPKPYHSTTLGYKTTTLHVTKRPSAEPYFPPLPPGDTKVHVTSAPPVLKEDYVPSAHFVSPKPTRGPTLTPKPSYIPPVTPIPKVTPLTPRPTKHVPPSTQPKRRPGYLPSTEATTYKPSLDLKKLQEFSYPMSVDLAKEDHHLRVKVAHSPRPTPHPQLDNTTITTTTTYSPPVYQPTTFSPLYNELVATTAMPLPSPDPPPNLGRDDYYYYYYYDNDGEYYYYDDDDDYFYDYDFFDIMPRSPQHVLPPHHPHKLPPPPPKRPPIPHHLIPRFHDINENEIYDFGYIAGIPGRAGRDYPILSYIPQTSFGCDLVADYPGYYADMEAGCQVFHVCHRDGRIHSFLCPNGTIFNQKYFVCDWWYNFACEDAPFFYPVNAAIGQPSVPLHKNVFKPHPKHLPPPIHHPKPQTYRPIHHPQAVNTPHILPVTPLPHLQTVPQATPAPHVTSTPHPLHHVSPVTHHPKLAHILPSQVPHISVPVIRQHSTKSPHHLTKRDDQLMEEGEPKEPNGLSEDKTLWT